jgi:hypothetical protein
MEIATGLTLLPRSFGVDLPQASWGVRGGATVRPLAVHRRVWHPWSLGLVAAWTRATESVVFSGGSTDDVPSIRRRGTTDTWRVAIVNQLWLSQRKHALHLDATLGMANSHVRALDERAFGTHAEIALGWAGWGAFFVGADFLDRDARIALGMRAHGIVAAPIVLLTVVAMAAGGAL